MRDWTILTHPGILPKMLILQGQGAICTSPPATAAPAQQKPGRQPGGQADGPGGNEGCSRTQAVRARITLA